MHGIGIMWFRRDLRLADNPALAAAAAECEHLIPVYIHAPEEEAPWQPGAASRWWLHHSLAALDADLRGLGSRLVLGQESSLAALEAWIAKTGAEAVYLNRLYEPATRSRDQDLVAALCEQGVAVRSYNAALLNEPWAIRKQDDTPYKVFTPYWRACQHRGSEPAPAPPPDTLPPVPQRAAGTRLEALELLPTIRWDTGLADTWQPGEQGAQARLQAFVTETMDEYERARDRPDRMGTSRLSPHLHFGEIGPRQVAASIRAGVKRRKGRKPDHPAEAYLRQLAWREFAAHLLHHFPHTPGQPLDARFKRFPWARRYRSALDRWQRGQTGIPIVDAGMRELWHTGWMHNRVRMIAASLLVKNLLIPWQRGAEWFWDTLVDADLGNNTLGWQWVAGCGADAAPYFRIFNPVTQGRRYDPEGHYVRQWVPEISQLPDRYLQEPWNAPDGMLHEAQLRLGRDYPRPIVDLKASRERALERFKALKDQTQQRAR